MTLNVVSDPRPCPLRRIIESQCALGDAFKFRATSMWARESEDRSKSWCPELPISESKPPDAPLRCVWRRFCSEAPYLHPRPQTSHQLRCCGRCCLVGAG
eukprot:587649-Rhodomonas_salina.1